VYWPVVIHRCHILASHEPAPLFYLSSFLCSRVRLTCACSRVRLTCALASLQCRHAGSRIAIRTLTLHMSADRFCELVGRCGTDQGLPSSVVVAQTTIRFAFFCLAVYGWIFAYIQKPRLFCASTDFLPSQRVIEESCFIEYACLLHRSKSCRTIWLRDNSQPTAAYG
jgi:hypothetical protein